MWSYSPAVLWSLSSLFFFFFGAYSTACFAGDNPLPHFQVREGLGLSKDDRP